MTGSISRSRGVVLVSDRQLGSYAAIGELFRRTLLQAGLAVESIALPSTAEERARLAGVARGRLVVHNTIGPRFEPLAGAVNVALVHHEWDRYPAGWIERLASFDEVWATTSFVRDTLRRSGLRVPVVLRKPALDVEDIPRKRDYRLRAPVRFLSCGDWHFRKGFHLLVAGFLQAFPRAGTATLTIKTSSACDWVPPRRDIDVVPASLGREAWLSLYRESDVYVTASLGEGLGMPVAEAVLAGVPVAANLWGGHRHLLRPPFLYRIRHEVVPQPFSSRPEYFAPGQRCALSRPRDIAAALRMAARDSAASRERMAEGARLTLLRRYGRSAVIPVYSGDCGSPRGTRGSRA